MTFNLDSLMAEASRRAGGLGDFGDARFQEPAEVLLTAMRSEAGLSGSGARILEERFIELLRNRLVMEDYFRRYPEIAREKIGDPVVIVGLPRTGTTLLQRILSRDRRYYPMLAWETRFPAPLEEPGTTSMDSRIALHEAEVRAMIEANPELLAIHPLNAREADEEGILLEHSFQSFFDAYVDIPDYTTWMWDHDQTPAYEHLERMLQFIQWQKRRRGEEASGWILKTPHHLRQIDVLFTVFPGTRVIQTHRDPLQTIPSIASFTFNLWKLYMQDPDPVRAGAQWSGIFARGVRETLAFRDRCEPGRFFDVWFADTLSRPLEVVESIYDYLGVDFPDSIHDRMQDYLADNQREKRPLHQYNLDFYGLSELQIKRDFAQYRERYILSRDA